MNLVNLMDPQQQVSFTEAVKIGLGRNQGVFFPQNLVPLEDINALLAMPFQARSSRILQHLIGDELPSDTLDAMVKSAFNFPAPLVEVESGTYCLELFHGPTLAFKDFGGRFMSECISLFNQGERVTILTATSGDTGAAVAHAFYGKENVDVVILYPKGKISLAQQKLFTTLGGNIHCFAVDGSFDDCQALVKQAFLDDEVKSQLGLNSANSINISRLLAQVCYYFEAFAQLKDSQREQVHVSVPSGNFGNVCAAMIAAAIGLPVKKLSATTNQNDTVPRYIETGNWSPNATLESLSNAMDVSKPNNWPRVESMLNGNSFAKDDFYSCSVSESRTQEVMKEINKLGYIAEPHTAIAYEGLRLNHAENETGIFLATAHPAKFKESVEGVLEQQLEMPEVLAAALAKQCLAESISADYEGLKKRLFEKLVS
ncbi:threonine synthase [Pseudoalteromonas luteoviolacea]|uniref:Threonine synthase n=1 Tax=Pseudoalteromonas luteoviolacea (strain 2ta16) TaxID=1353533 RepID=V4HT71_PSEL2|nr:threonine synthase [Pseudoalteromonas luteoviolacea]ESP94010.1 threonine synthase [Pseudoalteromonas luteoviolacea 2ta16]KZN33501.1 threonine synthase [Pseudoalteromonas luteoviolacea NCIMB 1944]